jgi:hypothetical protein
MSGLMKVQWCVVPQGALTLKNADPFPQAEWHDAEILPPPARWSGGLPEGRLPADVVGIDTATGRPRTWPMCNTVAHWTAGLTGLRPGKYDLCCRTIDAKGIAQPLPRPLLKSGYNAIQRKPLVVEASWEPSPGLQPSGLSNKCCSRAPNCEGSRATQGEFASPTSIKSRRWVRSLSRNEVSFMRTNALRAIRRDDSVASSHHRVRRPPSKRQRFGKVVPLLFPRLESSFPRKPGRKSAFAPIPGL